MGWHGQLARSDRQPASDAETLANLTERSFHAVALTVRPGQWPGGIGLAARSAPANSSSRIARQEALLQNHPIESKHEGGTLIIRHVDVPADRSGR
jgi:hypothetical protein